MRQDRGVRRPRSLFADQPGDMITIELDGQPRRQLVRHEHYRMLDLAKPRVVCRTPEELQQHPELDGIEIGKPVTQQRLACVLPRVAEFERLELIRALGRKQVLPDQGLDAREEFPVLHHHDLRVEDACSFGARALECSQAQSVELLHYDRDGGVQTSDLGIELRWRDGALRNRRKGPTHGERRGECDPGRNANPPQHSIRHDSPNP